MVNLQKISVMSLAKVFAVLHALIGLILGVIVTIGSMSGSENDGFWGLGPWSLLVFPIVNAGLGFLTGILLAWSYNIFSQWFGGIEFKIEINEQ